MNLPLLLLGPDHAGKTSVGKLLAAQLDLPLHHLWEFTGEYWKEAGYTEEAAQTAWDNGGNDGLYHYYQPLEAHAIERAVKDHPHCILELGAPQSVYDDPALFERVRTVLEPYAHIALILPTPDVDAALEILRKREEVIFEGREMNEHFIRHPSNYELAKQVVYTEGKTPEETCEDLFNTIDSSAPEVILIGPMGTGKSTQGRLLAKRLGVPQVSLDAVRFDYYKEIGWSEEAQKEVSDREGPAGVLRYWKPFEVYSVGRLLEDHRHCVMDFGAGQSVYTDEEQFARVRDLLAPYPNVALLLPSPDPDRSIEILRDRKTRKINGMDCNRYFMTNPSNREFAKIVVYTEGKTPEETADEVSRRFQPLG
jgi:hypothetical protein